MKSLFNIANETCLKLLNWFSANGLSLNFNKTSFMLFTPSYIDNSVLQDLALSVSINNITINRVKCCKYLGVLIDDCLSWSEHIEYVKTKVIQTTGFMYKYRDLLSPHYRKVIYFALIYPNVIYGIEIYGKTFSSYLQPLNVAVNRALRIMQNATLDTPLLTLYTCFNTLPVLYLHQFLLNKLIHRCIYQPNTVPNIIRDIFNCDTQVHNYSTRSNTSLYLYRYSDPGYQNSFSHYACSNWNHLPNIIRQTTSPTIFSNKLKLHYLSILN